MLLRTISGLLGLAILLGALWAGLVWVFLITLMAAILGIREFYRLHPPSRVPVENGPSPAEVAPMEEGDINRDVASPSEPEIQPRPIPVESPGQAPEATIESPDPPSPTPLPWLVGVVWTAAFAIAGAGAEGLVQFWLVSAGVFAVGGFVALLWLVAFYHGPRWPVATAYLFGGPVYVGFMLAHVLLLAQAGEVLFKLDPLAFDPLAGPTIYEVGRNWLLFALLTNFATDTGAYLVGRSLGRHRMAPVTSPNKTWEGAAGGFVCAILAAFLLDRVLNLGLGPTGWDGAWTGWNWQPVAIGATVGMASQCGDLLESRLKRLSQVKDSGFLVPGHGGALDRLDSLLITFPVVYYLLMAVLRL